MTHQDARAIERLSQILRTAALLRRIMGYNVAATYLRWRGFTLDEALGILLGTRERSPDTPESLRKRGLL